MATIRTPTSRPAAARASPARPHTGTPRASHGVQLDVASAPPLGPVRPDRPAPAAHLDGRGRQRPLRRRGRGRRAGAKPSLGDGHHDQDHAQRRRHCHLPPALTKEPGTGRPSGPRGGSLVLPPRPGWRDLAGRCWHARPPAASTPPTKPAPESPTAGPAATGAIQPGPRTQRDGRFRWTISRSIASGEMAWTCRGATGD
jgi:hypothetical protein